MDYIQFRATGLEWNQGQLSTSDWIAEWVTSPSCFELHRQSFENCVRISENNIKLSSAVLRSVRVFSPVQRHFSHSRGQCHLVHFSNGTEGVEVQLITVCVGNVWVQIRRVLLKSCHRLSTMCEISELPLLAFYTFVRSEALNGTQLSTLN